MSEEVLVREFLKKDFLFSDDGKIGDEEPMLDKGILDSTGVLEFVAFLERTFAFTVQHNAAAFVRRKRLVDAAATGA